MVLDRPRLLAAKLRALVNDRWGAGERMPDTFPGGAALFDPATGAGWVLVDDNPRPLGPALVWGEKAGAEQLHVLAEPDADARPGVLARQAAQFTTPPAVWRIDGRALEPAAPEPLPAPAPLPPAVAAFADIIRAAGADPVVAHGELMGEVAGLEVARVVVDDATGEPSLEIGVGQHDQEAQRMVHGDTPPAQVLERVVRTVAAHRRPGAPAHPLNQLGRAHLLRSRILAEPGMVDADHLLPVVGPLVRHDLRIPVPSLAAGIDRQGRPLLVACSVGIDLDLVPEAADARLADGRDPRLVLAVPERDDHPVIRQLAALLRDPAEVVAVPA